MHQGVHQGYTMAPPWVLMLMYEHLPRSAGGSGLVSDLRPRNDYTNVATQDGRKRPSSAAPRSPRLRHHGQDLQSCPFFLSCGLASTVDPQLSQPAKAGCSAGDPVSDVGVLNVCQMFVRGRVRPLTNPRHTFAASDFSGPASWPFHSRERLRIHARACARAREYARLYYKLNVLDSALGQFSKVCG